MIGAFFLAALGGLIAGWTIGFFMGIEVTLSRRPGLEPPRTSPQVIRRDPDRIEQTVFTPRDYHPGPGWTYYPGFKEWRRGARY